MDFTFLSEVYSPTLNLSCRASALKNGRVDFVDGFLIDGRACAFVGGNVKG